VDGARQRTQQSPAGAELAERRSKTPPISPDGRLLAYVTNDSGRLEVYVQILDKDGGAPVGLQNRELQVSGGGGNFPRWRGDGKGVVLSGFERNVDVGECDAWTRGPQA
jgi:Tol biopolymer transport system component